MVADFLELGVGETVVGAIRACNNREHELLWLFDCQLSQDHGINDAKHHGIQADPKRQRQNRNGGKSRIRTELPQRMPGILEQPVHAPTSAISFFSSSSATTLPSNRCTSRCACLANRGSCVTMQIVAPSRCRSASSSMTASPFRESKLPVGSSASRIDGFPPRARATATRCC